MLFLLQAIVTTAQPKNPASLHEFSGQWRSIFMATENEGELKDFNALATGGYFKYQYKPGKHWQFGSAIYNTLNLGLSDLQIPDPITGKLSRYEEGLFDRQNLNNAYVALLGEIFLTYSNAGNSITLGRFKLTSPQINPEDGRMIPTLVQGIWYNHFGTNKNGFQFGILNRIAPRSTGSFMPIGKSIGAYPTGKDINGAPSLYANNTDSDFVFVSNFEKRINHALHFSLWNYFTDNISNTFYFKSEWNISDSWGVDSEWLHQNRIGNGGNTLEDYRYFQHQRADVLGLQIRHMPGKSKFQLGYDYILPGGRFQFPREWGREYFFSFQKLERSEGSANNHALVLSYQTPILIKPETLKVRPILSAGRHWKANVLEPENNKYSLPNYAQYNLDVYFDFLKIPDLHPELLFTYKDAKGSFPDNPNFSINKVNMFHMSLIVNYNF
ncbi:MAG: hypothetical protein RLZZ241_646 [Bacteroidota bacterium]